MNFENARPTARVRPRTKEWPANARMRVTLWNRTRTSRVSAERADQLRKGDVCDRATCRGRVIVVDYSLVIAPSSPCRCRPAVSAVARGTVDSRAMQSAAVRGQGFEPRFHESESCVLPLDEPRSSCRAGRCRTFVASLKGKCSTVELRPQDGGTQRRFSLELRRHHVPFVGVGGVEPPSAHHATGLQPACFAKLPHSRKREEPPGRISPGRLQNRLGYLCLIYESGAFPSYVMGCGSRLIPTTVPWPAKFAWPCQSRRAHTCPTTLWRLVTLVAFDAIDMTATKRMLARRYDEVNESVDHAFTRDDG